MFWVARRWPWLAVVCALALAGGSAGTTGAAVPHLVLVVGDDLGHADVGWNNPAMQPFSPRLTELATTGVRFLSLYAQPVCSPTRGALLTGRYPMRWGLLHHTFNNDDRFGLFTNETLLPTLLAESYGYQAHMVGKWHLGFAHERGMPTARGFQSFLGFLSGEQDYFWHNETDNTGAGYDLRNDTAPVRWLNGSYSTFVYTQRAVDIISDLDPTGGPLFLYLSYQAVHAPSQVPAEYVKIGANLSSPLRQVLRGMVKCMDEGVGNVTDALTAAGLWEDTLLLFLSDNGGPVNSTGAANGQCNAPLRGSKHTLWDGGVRVAAFANGGFLQRQADSNLLGNTVGGFMHVADLVPTLSDMLVSTAGGPGLVERDGFAWDGFSAWPLWTQAGAASARTEALLNFDPLASSGNNGCCGFAGLRWDEPGTARQWKLLVDPGEPAAVFGCAEADASSVAASPRGVQEWVAAPPGPAGALDPALLSPAAAAAGVGWLLANRTTYLFDVATDPTESFNVIADHPTVVATMAAKILGYVAQAPPDGHCDPDPASRPKLQTGENYFFWTPWLTGLDDRSWCYLDTPAPTPAPTA